MKSGNLMVPDTGPYHADTPRASSQLQRKRSRRKKPFTSRPYKCSRGCNKAYASFSAKQYHEQANHSFIRYRCLWILCTKTYTSIYELKKHENKGHASLGELKEKNTEFLGTTSR